MKTLSLEFDELDYPMMEIKWNTTKSSSQATQAYVNEKISIWQSLEVICKS